MFRSVLYEIHYVDRNIRIVTSQAIADTCEQEKYHNSERSHVVNCQGEGQFVQIEKSGTDGLFVSILAAK